MVVKCNYPHRTAQVRWYEDCEMLHLSSRSDEVSIYEIETPDHLDFSPMTIGLVVGWVNSTHDELKQINEKDFLVDVLRVDNDGRVLVRYWFSNQTAMLAPSQILKLQVDENQRERMPKTRTNTVGVMMRREPQGQ